MPKTKVQSIVFTALMVFCMVYCMTVYTVSMKLGSLSYAVLAMALKEMWVEYLIVFLLIFFIIAKLAYAENDKPRWIATHCSHSDNPVFDRVLDRSLHYTVCHLLSRWITFRLAAPMDSVGCAVLPRRPVPSDILCWAACPAGVPDIVPQLMSAIVRSAVIMLSLRAFRPTKWGWTSIAKCLRMRFVIRRHSHYVILFSA